MKKKTTNKKKQKTSFTRFLALFALGGFLLGTLFIFGFYYAVAGGLFGKIPSNEELKAIKNFQGSDIYSADKQLMGRYFIENRSNVSFEELAPCISQALVATEDVRFFTHEGIDQRSLMRVLFKTIILGQNTGGGSTISQQLAKNLFGREQYGFLTMPVVKIKEGIIANKLNELYTKNEILTLYLNTVSLGEDTYGIETASERFFNKPPQNITVEEAAVLIGMLKAPTTYNPRLNPKDALRRRNTVLSQMFKYNYLTQTVYDSLKALPITLNYTRKDKNEGIAGYFREYAKQEIETLLSKYKKENEQPYDLYTDGLKVYTTIDTRLQLAAEKALKNHIELLTKQIRKELWVDLTRGSKKNITLNALKKSARYQALQQTTKTEKELLNALRKPIKTTLITFKGEVDTTISPLDSVAYNLSFLQAAYMAVNPQQGNLLAWVGGINYKHFPYDRVLASRQLGSVFKPLVYAKALERGRGICDKINNEQIKYTQFSDWSPKNSDGQYGGKYSLIGALTNSINTVSVQLLMENGIKNQLDFCSRLGIEDSLPAVPSLALGTANVSLKKILEVYTVFANEGKKQPIYFIEKITTADDVVIYQHEQTNAEQLIDPLVAHNITRMLQSVTDSGTANRLRYKYKLENDIAGKTGTTQNQTDGWFIGYTPTFLAGVWTGADNPQIHFSSIRDGQGANMALPIWAETFKNYTRTDAVKQLYTPAFNYDVKVNCDLYYPERTDFIYQLFKRKTPRENESDGLEGKKKRKKFSLFKRQ